MNRFNYRCPQCGDPDHIDIMAFVSVALTSTGAVFLDNPKDLGPESWSSECGAGCSACGYEGVAREFEPQPAKLVSLDEFRRR
ncbi:MAG TPA: hypothetical protein VMF67_15630 [Rhizomicrobium sp.]|nr:hypothetical protein [Rhizomicrobium sp.]